MAQACTQGDHQLQGAGDSQDYAGPAPVVVAFRSVTGVLESLSRSHQSQQLGGVDGLQHVGRDVELHGVEVDGGEEPAPLAVGAIRALGVLVEVVGQLPVGGRNIGDGVDPLGYVGPVGVHVIRLGEETTDADDGQWYRSGGKRLFRIGRFHLRYTP